MGSGAAGLELVRLSAWMRVGSTLERGRCVTRRSTFAQKHLKIEAEQVMIKDPQIFEQAMPLDSP